MNSTPNAVWLDWKRRESYLAACARYDVAWLTVRQALGLGLTLATAQRVVNWQQRTRG